MKINIEVPPSPCANCNELNDRASTFYDATPNPGDFSLCAYCGHLMVFADDLTLRNPTDAEMQEMAGDPRIIALQLQRLEMKHALRGKHKK